MIEKISYCGLYCGACPSYLKGTCLGCRSDDKSQPRKSKWGCKIRKCCIGEKNVEYCGLCNDFPCTIINKKLIHSHLNDQKFNYRHEIPNNIKAINEIGIEEWCKEQNKKWICPECNNRITFYNYKCISCGKEMDPQVNE